MDILSVIGALGAFAFAISGVPQAIRSWKLGTSRGMSGTTIALWLTGEACMLAYTVATYPGDFVLLGNYLANFLIVSLIAWYYLFPRT